MYLVYEYMYVNACGPYDCVCVCVCVHVSACLRVCIETMANYNHFSCQNSYLLTDQSIHKQHTIKTHMLKSKKPCL